MALLDTMVGVMSNQAMNWMVGGEAPHRVGNGHVNLAPYQSFSCADGDMIIAVGNDGQFAKLCEILGLPELASSPRFATAALRVNNRQELAARLQSAIAVRRCGELTRSLEASGVPAGPINTLDKVFADPQVKARGLQISAEEQEGAVPGLASPIVIDGARAVSAKASPRLGEDDDAQWY